jgi:hypothetical protein
MKNLNQALVKFHASLKPIQKDAQNPFFKSDYLTLSGIIDAIRPLLSANGLAVVQSMKVDSGINILITTLLHESGEQLASEIILPSHADPQKFGSLITYYKRYQLQALLLISTSEEDDDANSIVPEKAFNQTPKPVTASNNAPASDAQKGLLKRLGIQFTADISKNEASKLIEQSNKGK